eukprot:1146016-Pelagomonas_calceolata.AAC.9
MSNLRLRARTRTRTHAHTHARTHTHTHTHTPVLGLAAAAAVARRCSFGRAPENICPAPRPHVQSRAHACFDLLHRQQPIELSVQNAPHAVSDQRQKRAGSACAARGAG